jgi:hypothetical protein
MDNLCLPRVRDPEGKQESSYVLVEDVSEEPRERTTNPLQDRRAHPPSMDVKVKDPRQKSIR